MAKSANERLSVSKRTTLAPPSARKRSESVHNGIGPNSPNNIKPSHFLESNKVGNIVQTAIVALLEARPSSPIGFLANHFEWEWEKSSSVRQAAQLLSQVHYSQPTFSSRLLKAYLVVNQCPVQQGQRGLMGDVYLDLLQLLLRKIPEKESSRLLDRLHCRSTEVIPFCLFRSGVLTCLVFHEYVYHAQELYRDLDLYNETQVRRCVGDAILTQLWAATNSPDPDNVISALSIGSNLGNVRNVAEVLGTTVNSEDSRTITADRFLAQAVDIFLVKVRENN